MPRKEFEYMELDDVAAVGKRIRELRLAAGLTQRELAELTGTSSPAVAQYEKGLHKPGIEVLMRFMTACGATVTIKSPWVGRKSA